MINDRTARAKPDKTIMKSSYAKFGIKEKNP